MSNIIIGGGITGLYLAYEFSKKTNPEYITLIEKTNRLGGRIYSCEEHNYDIGASRFNKNHKLLINLINDLGLSNKVKKITTKKHYFINKSYVKSEKELLNKFNINEYNSIKQIWKQICKLANNLDSTYLDTISIEELINNLMGSKICKLLKYTTGYGSKFSNTKASTSLIALKRDYGILGLSFYILEGGMEQIIEKLQKILIEKGVNILLNHELNKIDKQTKHIIVNNSVQKKISYNNLFICTDINALNNISSNRIPKDSLSSVKL